MIEKHPYSCKIVPTAEDPSKFRLFLLEDGHWIGSPLEPYDSRAEAEEAGRREVDNLAAAWIFGRESSEG
jgi:hypothetical protein